MSQVTARFDAGCQMCLRLFVRSVAIFCASLLALAAFAQGPEPTKFYLGLGVGPIIPQSVSANLNGTIVGGGTLKFNASGFVGLLIGYRFTHHLGVEGEGGWTLYDSYNLTGTFSRVGSQVPGTILLNGDMHTWLGLLNVLYRPRRQSARLAPYFGAGVGAAGLEWLVTSRSGGSISLSLRGGSGGFAPDGIAGVEYSLTKRFSLGGRYNFVAIESDGPTLSGGGIVLRHTKPYLHILQATGTYRF
jgi:opacity protein-like surface antigen